MTGCSVLTTNGSPMKISATVTPIRREGHLDPVGLDERAEHPVRRIQRGQRNARDRGRQRKRQIDQGIDDPASGNSYRTSTQATRKPNTALTMAATARRRC